MNELITLPPQPPERCKFRRQQEVYFVGSNIMRPCAATVIDHYDFKDAVRVMDSQDERIVTVSDLVSKEEYAKLRAAFIAEREAKKREEDRERLLPVIQMWQRGIRTPQEMAAGNGGGPVVKYYAQIKAAKARGFIE